MPNNNNIPSAAFFDFNLYQLDDASVQKVDNPAKIGIISTSLTEENQLFLSKIMLAIQLDLNKDIDLYEAQIQYKDLCKDADYTTLLIFGYTPQMLGLNIQINNYQIVKFKHTHLLFAHDLETISTDISKKKLLWQQLQLLFI